MIDRTTRLRLRRKIRSNQRRVEDIGYQAEDHLEKHFFKRLHRLLDVSRFVLGWLLLLILLTVGVSAQIKALGQHYQDLRPVGGGTYSEGLIGNFTNANPIYATGSVDSSVARLVFAGLFKYDSGNQLVNDLAESLKVDETGKVYTIKLRPHLKWHDGRPLTAADVIYTFQTIQNPDAKSPLFHAWRGVAIKQIDDSTISFTLSNPLAPFVHGLTTGIVPKHRLENIQASQLRSATFNTTAPIGSGPFVWDKLEVIRGKTGDNQQHIGLKSFPAYHRGAPKLTQFVIKTYDDAAQLIEGFKKQDVNAVVGLERLPEDLNNDIKIKEHTPTLTALNMIFFKTDSELLKDSKVRQALLMAVNVPAVVNGLGYPAVLADEPLLRGQLGYNPGIRQLAFNLEQTNKLLDDAGWKRPAPDQTRVNGPTKLEIKFYAKNNADFTYVSQQIQQAWQAVGVATKVVLLGDDDLNIAIGTRNYDVLLHGISIGNDPDVFAYWHSSQSDPRAASRLNFSNYKSSPADKSLEAGRSRTDAGLRAAKYLPFLQSWRSDVPAMALYQPRFLYLTRGPLFGFESKTINSATDRFNNVENWMIREDYVPKP